MSLHKEIKLLNNLNDVKVIFYQHLGIFDWIYGNYSIFKSIYSDYINSKYIVNIVPYENDFFFSFSKMGNKINIYEYFYDL